MRRSVLSIHDSGWSLSSKWIALEDTYFLSIQIHRILEAMLNPEGGSRSSCYEKLETRYPGI